MIPFSPISGRIFSILLLGMAATSQAQDDAARTLPETDAFDVREWSEMNPTASVTFPSDGPTGGLDGLLGPAKIFVDRDKLVPGLGLQAYYPGDLQVEAVSITSDVIPRLCSAVSFGDATGSMSPDDPQIVLSRKTSFEGQRCSPRPAETTPAIRTTFSNDGVIEIPVGRYGYLVLSNRLFPGEGGRGSAISSERLNNAIAFAIDKHASVPRKFEIQMVVERAGYEVCSCVHEPGSDAAQKLLASGSFSCVKRDETLRPCPGSRERVEPVLKKRVSFGSSEDSFIAYSNSVYSFEERNSAQDFDVMFEWCEFDAMLPCTEIAIAVLGDTDEAKTAAKFMFSKACPTCTESLGESRLFPLLDGGTYETALREASLKNGYPTAEPSLFAAVNDALASIVERDEFALVLIPYRLVSLPELRTRGLVLLNTNPSVDVKQQLELDQYPFTEKIFFYVHSRAITSHKFRKFFDFVFSRADIATPSSCDHRDLECFANMNSGSTRGMAWWTPIQH
ncbi:hypothetical protein [Rhizobium johnstonii]|uniref:hypothetical protein n=1 Tax=Rhizobium johnstonii TaxID=3019933 RepID=UPI003F9E6320